MGVYAAKVPLIMGKAAVLAYVAGPTLRSMRVARWPGNTAAGPVVKENRGINAQAGGLRPMGLSTFTCSQREPSSWSSMILNDEVSANAILKRVTKHYTVVIKPQTTT